MCSDLKNIQLINYDVKTNNNKNEVQQVSLVQKFILLLSPGVITARLQRLRFNKSEEMTSEALNSHQPDGWSEDNSPRTDEIKQLTDIDKFLFLIYSIKFL